VSTAVIARRATRFKIVRFTETSGYIRSIDAG
jgi:hypothetical protein